jgi:hypothetical protein
VRENPDALAFVWRSNGVRSKHSPLRIVPDRGQVAENSSESPTSESWGVFHEHESRSNLANDPEHFGPKSAALSVKPGSASRDANVLARESARNDVNNSSPGVADKTSNVRPNRENGQRAVVLPLRKNGCAVGIKFNGAHGFPPEEFSPEYSSTSAREKSQLIHANSSLV